MHCARGAALALKVAALVLIIECTAMDAALNAFLAGRSAVGAQDRGPTRKAAAPRRAAPRSAAHDGGESDDASAAAARAAM